MAVLTESPLFVMGPETLQLIGGGTLLSALSCDLNFTAFPRVLANTNAGMQEDSTAFHFLCKISLVLKKEHLYFISLLLLKKH